MKTALLLSLSLTMAACTTDDGGSAFVGTYRTTLTLSGTGSQTLTDTLAIAEGQTADLILTSQQLGAMKATIVGGGAFALDQQQITLTDASGRVFSVTLQGQGTVSNGVLAASGQLSSSSGALSLTMNGSRQ